MNYLNNKGFDAYLVAINEVYEPTNKFGIIGVKK